MVGTRYRSEFIRTFSDMIVELYNFDDYMTYPLNRTDALRKCPLKHSLSHDCHTECVDSAMPGVVIIAQ